MSAPSEYTQEMADCICEQLAAGKSLKSICEAEGMPDRRTVYRWMDKRPEFQERYENARNFGAMLLADDLLEIADDGRNDWVLARRGEKDVVVCDIEHINRSRLRVDTRKWMLARMLPKLYGDKIEHTGTVNHVNYDAVVLGLVNGSSPEVGDASSAQPTTH